MCRKTWMLLLLSAVFLLNGVGPASAGKTTVSGNAPVVVVASQPASGFIDPLEDINQVTGSVEGINRVTVTFNQPVFDPATGRDLGPDNFVIKETNSFTPPHVSRVTPVSATSYTISLDRPLTAGACSTITPVVMNQAGTPIQVEASNQVVLGFLPGDVNQDRVVNAFDTQVLIQRIQGGNPQKEFSDIDRSGTTGPSDILRFIDVLNGAHASQAWNGVSMPSCSSILQLTGAKLFGMEVISATGSADGSVTVTTTGAIYILRPTGMDMWRRIDPATNDVNPRLVADLTAIGSWSPFTLTSATSEKVVVDSSKATFTFMSDSLVLIQAKQPLSYTHRNLIANAPWNKKGASSLDRMWTDGYGGSLHAKASGNPGVTADSDNTDLQLAVNDTMAHMVFPPKRFDLEGVYGASARPFVQFLYTNEQVRDWMATVPVPPHSTLDLDAADGFGVIVLDDEGLYSILDNANRCGANSNSRVFRQPSGYCGYEFQSPQLIRDFITLAHNKGFKVITYMYEPGDPGWWAGQSVASTTEWMRLFQTNYDLDGWFFDGMVAGNLMQTYEFAKQVRHDVGDDGIIFHHSSWDAVGAFNDEVTRTSGVQAVYVNAYTNYQLVGETGDIAAIDYITDPYLHYWSTGYGIAQNWGSHKLSSNPQSHVTEDQMQDMMAYMNGVQRRTIANGDADAWHSSYKPTYNAVKTTYLNGNFVPYRWPLHGGQPIHTTFNMTSSTTPGGTIFPLPAGTVTVPQDSSKVYVFAPQTGYHLNYIEVDGVPSNEHSYVFTHIQRDHTINGVFSANGEGGGTAGAQPCSTRARAISGSGLGGARGRLQTSVSAGSCAQ